MSADCCGHDHHHIDPNRGDAGYRRVLWAVLAINATMFLVEVAAGVAAGSASLLADAVDFFGDAANYAVSLFVIGMALRFRAYAALGKGISMGLFGLWVTGTVIWHAVHGTLPSAMTMGAVGLAAFAANAASFALLWAYRAGDANMRSAWICTRNDAAGNLAVLLAAAVCSAPAPDGLIWSSRPSWRASRCRAPGSCCGRRRASCAGRFQPRRIASLPPLVPGILRAER